MHSLSYGRFKKNVPLESFSPPELLARLFLKASRDMEDIVDAIDKNDIERRFLISQNVSDFFAQLSSYLDGGTSPEQRHAYQTLKTYCGGTVILISRMNFKNDRAIARAIQQSLVQSAQILRHMVANQAHQEMTEDKTQHSPPSAVRFNA